MTSRYLRPADQIDAQPARTSPWLTVLHLLLIFAAFAFAGRVDLEEEERASMESYVNAHAQVVSGADLIRECR